MKHRRKYLLILVWLLIFLGETAFSVSLIQRSIAVVADPRLELLAVVQYLSGYDKMTSLDFFYKQDVERFFSPFRDHNAVKMFAEMSKAGFSYDAPPASMLYLSNPPDLIQLMPFTEYLIKRAGGKEKLDQFIAVLRDFARETQFMAFFEWQGSTYARIVNETTLKLPGPNSIETLENYYGMTQRSYTIILVPLFRGGGYGPRIEHEDGTYDVYSIIGTANVLSGFPDFGTAENFKSLIWHEFGHSFVNPTTAKSFATIAKYYSLLNPILSFMQNQAYGTWETCVNEHIIRAITSRFKFNESGWVSAATELKYHKNLGFLYIEFLYKQMELYEAQRTKYPTFVLFYPELIATFKMISENSSMFSF